MTDDPQRLQKVLAAAGVGSRRKVEDWIRAGRITVNGKAAALGIKVTAADQVALDGTLISITSTAKPRVLVYHKPVGEICTRSDPQHRKTVFDSLPALTAGRWISVGRLDINSSGLLLLTTDGALANALMRPAAGVVREYRVRVLGTVSDKMLRQLQKGIQLDDGFAQFKSVKAQESAGGANRWFVCRLARGRNREVRRLWEAVGCQVNRLIRTRYGTVRLAPGLAPGASVELDKTQLAQLYRCCGIEASRP